MRKRIVGILTAMLMLVGVGAAVANDEAAHPPGAPEHCQNLGDDRDGDNSDNGLDVARVASDVIDQEDPDCENSSNSRRPE